MQDFAKEGLMELRGRASYSCEDFKTNCERGADLRQNEETACTPCPYKRAKEQFLSGKIGVTNFDYFLAEALYSRQLPKRSVLVIDEAHNLEQKALGFADFEISPFSLQKYSVAIPAIQDGDMVGACQWIQTDVLPAVDGFISRAEAEEQQDLEDRRQAASLLARMRRFVDTDQSEWTYWNDQRRFVFRPLSAAKYAHDFLFARADMVVIMSATILDFDVFCRTLGLMRRDCECLALPSDFQVTNRQIFYKPVGSMSWSGKEVTLPKIAEELARLLEAYPGQKGLVHTNSYTMNQYFVKALTAAGFGKRVITHGSGGAEMAIERHRSGTGPTVLFSPAMTEGVDLPGDLCRFQVVVKVPFLNFRDPYVAARKQRDRRWYDWQTAMHLIQATGRSVRSETDFADTYILDKDFGAFRQRSRNLLPEWWLAAIKEILD